MEAPEKIYRTTTYLDSYRGKTVWKNKPVPGAENVEYVRKDAFIDKVCGWLKEIFFEYENLTDYNPTEDFKNYMKGE